VKGNHAWLCGHALFSGPTLAAQRRMFTHEPTACQERVGTAKRQKNGRNRPIGQKQL
jgi:hypothetical protein